MIHSVYDCFTYAIKAAEILKIDSDKTERRKQIRENLPDFKIGSDGRLLEWNKEFKEKEPGHRHLSHLYGVFPSNLFTPERNTEQFSAAQKSLDFRLKHLGGHTGWSRAWCACLYARFGRASEFYKHIRYLIDNFSTSSLLDLHPPRIFQIDGNLGGAEAILQALLQLLYSKSGIFVYGQNINGGRFFKKLYFRRRENAGRRNVKYVLSVRRILKRIYTSMVNVVCNRSG